MRPCIPGPGPLCRAVAGALLACFLAGPASADGPNYWIDESTDFTGNGCQNTDLNNVTSSLRSELNNRGWTGTRWSNANAWPEDFIEQNLGGIDHVAADARTLSVYAGHGWRALIQFGFQRNGICTVSFPPSTRLGLQGGDRSVYAMWVTSCTVNLDSLSGHFDQQIRQTFGYHNSPSVKDNQPRDFFRETDNLRNERAWIEEMEDRPGWFTGDNSPIALTFGVSPSHCNWVQDTARLRDQTLLYQAPSPHSRYCYLMFDNGQSGC